MSVFDILWVVIPVFDVVQHCILPFLIGDSCLTNDDICLLEKTPRVPYEKGYLTYLDKDCTVEHDYGMNIVHVPPYTVVKNGICWMSIDQTERIERISCPNVYNKSHHPDASSFHWFETICDHCLLRVVEYLEYDKLHRQSTMLKTLYHSINDEPAVIDYKKQTSFWYLNGFKHRLGGKPAVIGPDRIEWYSKGHLICKYDFTEKEFVVIQHDYNGPFSILLPATGMRLGVCLFEKETYMKTLDRHETDPKLLNETIDTSYLTCENPWDRDDFMNEDFDTLSPMSD